MKTKHFDSISEIKQCFELMKVLRPGLVSEDNFAQQIVRQQKDSYRILGVMNDETLVAIAGYREAENLVHGKYLYVDDLVTLPDFRGKNFGEVLLNEISDIAKAKGISKVVLDTRLDNSKAQKFYYRVGYLGICMRFIKEVK